MIGQSAQAILQRRVAEAERNRAAMPQVSAWVDDLKAGGIESRVTFAQEGGRTLGKPVGGVAVQPIVASVPVARNTDPATSHDAASNAQSFTAKHEAKIYGALHDAGFVGLTAKEIAAKTGLTDVQVSRRTAAMSTPTRKLIRRNGVRRDGCCVWVVG